MRRFSDEEAYVVSQAAELTASLAKLCPQFIQSRIVKLELEFYSLFSMKFLHWFQVIRVDALAFSWIVLGFLVLIVFLQQRHNTRVGG